MTVNFVYTKLQCVVSRGSRRVGLGPVWNWRACRPWIMRVVRAKRTSTPWVGEKG